MYICFLRFLHEIIISYFLHLSFHFFLFILSSLCFCFLSVVYFLLTCDLAAAKLQLVAAEGGASTHSRLQRCMRRARSLQQRMHLQQQQDSEAGRPQPEQQQEEGQQLQEQPRYHL